MVDTAINHIIEVGLGELLAKIDIKSVFLLLPVHPSDHHLLAIEWIKGIWNLHTYLSAIWPEVCFQLISILADLFSRILDQKSALPTIHITCMTHSMLIFVMIIILLESQQPLAHLHLPTGCTHPVTTNFSVSYVAQLFTSGLATTTRATYTAG